MTEKPNNHKFKSQEIYLFTHFHTFFSVLLSK